MKLVLFTLGVLAGTSVFGTCAEAQNYPWCAYYGDGEGENCGFSTFDQCMATRLGLGGFCLQNDWYKPPASAPGQRLGHRSHTHS